MVPGEHLNVPSFRFPFRGTSAKTTLLSNHPFVNFGKVVEQGGCEMRHSWFCGKSMRGCVLQKLRHFEQTLPGSSCRRCNLCGHLQMCQMPDIENSRKTAEKGAEWVTIKQPKNSRKNSQNTRKTVKTAVFSGGSAVLPAAFRLLCRDPLGTLFGCFPAVFNVEHLAPL